MDQIALPESEREKQLGNEGGKGGGGGHHHEEDHPPKFLEKTSMSSASLFSRIWAYFFRGVKSFGDYLVLFGKSLLSSLQQPSSIDESADFNPTISYISNFRTL